MAHIIKGVVQNVNSGIGLASEAYKARQQSKSDRSQSPPTSEGRPAEEAEERIWNLDEAQDELPEQIASPSDRPINEETLANDFLSRLEDYTLPSTHTADPLLPIVVPQRRPNDRSRGFVRAYAPQLQTRGVDQATFITFIETFNKSTQASKWIAALNLASIGTMWLPTVTSIVVSAAIAAATTAAMELQGRYKTNHFLNKVNREFFMPRGLVCVVVTWNPEDSNRECSVDFQSIAAKYASGKSSRLRSSNGKTYGEFEWPETAPLIYPGLDAIANRSDDEAKAKTSSLKKKRAFVEDYMDRRAQAKFANDNPGSKLSQGPKPEFSSKFADPSHPINSGSLVSLITGGKIQHSSLGDRGGRSGMMGDRGGRGGLGGFGELGGGLESLRGGRDSAPFGRGFGGREAGDGGLAGRSLGRGLGGGRGSLGGGNVQGPLCAVQKVMKKNVLYLLIVDVETDQRVATI